MTAPRGTPRHWTCHRVISRRESPFMVLAKQNILNAKREKRTFCARLLHPQTRLMHPDRTHPSTMIQAYSSNTLKSPSLRTQLASPPYNDKCGARTHDQLSTEKRPLPRLEPMNTLAHRVTVIHWALTVGWPQTPSSPIRSQSRGRFESNLPCAPHPANGVQSAHIWLPIWLCLGDSVGKARPFSGPCPDGPLLFMAMANKKSKPAQIECEPKTIKLSSVQDPLSFHLDLLAGTLFPSWIMITSNVFGSIINQQGFWTLLKWMDWEHVRAQRHATTQHCKCHTAKSRSQSPFKI